VEDVGRRSDHGQAASALVRVGHQGVDAVKQVGGSAGRLHLSPGRLPLGRRPLGGVLDIGVQGKEEAEEGALGLGEASEVVGVGSELERALTLHGSVPSPTHAGPTV
jgi:hypothetical protein